MIRFIDLFSGIGGMRLGFEQACQELGIYSHCVLSSEIDKKAIETYNLNFCNIHHGDIREISQIPEFDFMLAGFPCQPFSYAGKQQGFGDTRGTLFFEIERILKTYHPRGFLLENVRGLTTHDHGRTFQTIIQSLQNIGYGITYRLLNSSNFGLPQNRVRIYIIGLLEQQPSLKIRSDRGAIDSHTFKKQIDQMNLFDQNPNQIKTVKDILESNVPEKYYLSQEFQKKLMDTVDGDIEKLHGVRLIDFRGGNSIHSWDLGLKGKCSQDERNFMNALIENRRLKIFGTHQDGKKLSLEQIRTFFDHEDLEKIASSLITKGYLKESSGKLNPVCGNMSFEVFKILDKDSISITLTSADSCKLGIVDGNQIRRLTPRECARLQGFPDSFKIHENDYSAYKQFGNSVSVPVVKEVLLDLLSSDNINGFNVDEAKVS